MKVRYTGCSDIQAKCAGRNDPRDFLAKGHTYTLLFKDVHSWSTEYELAEFPGKTFNSVCFDDIVEEQSFEEYWEKEGIRYPVGALELAFKEIAEKAWNAAKGSNV